MNPAEIIDGAIEGIQRDGLHKGEYVNPEDGKSTCMLGAMNRAYGVGVQFIPEFSSYGEDWGPLGEDYSDIELRPLQRAQDVVRRLVTGEGYHNIPDFNDDDHTSQEDVILILKKARATLD